MGESKAGIRLGGVPLITRPLAAMHAAGLEAIVVAKRKTQLPPLDAAVLYEPDEPSHPLAGIVAALERTARPLVVCGCDLPFVPAALLARLAQHGAPLVVVEAGGRLHPLIGRYEPRLLADLRAALDERRALHDVVDELGGERMHVQDYGDPIMVTFNVNTPADLERAEQLLNDRGAMQ
jgi:molybdopterin-guanine dinucleotide biosynthesis protein A